MEKIFSRFYYPIEFYNPHVHLEYNYNGDVGPNEAEIKALQLEEYKNKKAKMKKIKQKEFIRKYNKSAYLYEEEKRMKNEEERLNKKREQDEILLKKQNYNKTVYLKNMKPFLKERELKEKEKSKTNHKSKSINKSNKEIKIHNYELLKNNKNNENNLIPQENNDMESNLEINEIIKNLDQKENLVDNNNKNKKKGIDIGNNVIDLRINLENQLLEEIKAKNQNMNNNEIKDEVNDKISTIKRFRTYGVLPDQSQQENDKNKKKEKNKKFSSEFERRRFIKALKNIITERLGEHNIYIQNICSCGNLQKQLTALVEKGNFTVYALTEVDCANNCAFYKNKKDYLKSINDVLNSIKNIAYENFHNKNKEDK